MTYTSKKQTQFELFPGNSAPNELGAPKSPYIFKDLTLSQENIIVITIIFVVTMVLFFSLGVEKGKRVVLKDVAQQMTLTKAVLDQPVEVQEEAGASVQKISIMHESKQPQKNNAVNAAVEDKREVLEIKLDEDLKYTIQVASFRQAGSAKEEAKNLETKGHESFIMPKGTHSIVCVGRFAEKNDAQQYARKLNGRYGDYLIRRL